MKNFFISQGRSCGRPPGPPACTGDWPPGPPRNGHSPSRRRPAASAPPRPPPAPAGCPRHSPTVSAAARRRRHAGRRPGTPGPAPRSRSGGYPRNGGGNHRPASGRYPPAPHSTARCRRKPGRP